MGTVIFNGINSRDLGVEVETFPAYEYPEKEYQVYHVLGRNGDIIIDTDTYKNVPRTYRINAATFDRVEYYKLSNSIVSWLTSASGYARLEDSYEPEYYRLAYYKDSGSISNIFNEAGQATIKFICKPQRYLKSGDVPVEFTQASAIQNRTNFKSRPLIKVTKTYNSDTGTVTIGSYSFNVLAGSATTLYVDSELQDAYTTDPTEPTNQNGYISLNNGDFPMLVPGLNNISFTGDLTKVTITPRWFTI